MVQSNKFKNEFTFDKRLEESKKIREKHPERVPIIVTRAVGCKLKEMDKYKFLAPYDLTLGQFLVVIRKRIELDNSEALFVFINNTLINTSQSLGSIYDELKDKDGWVNKSLLIARVREITNKSQSTIYNWLDTIGDSFEEETISRKKYVRLKEVEI